MPVVPGAAQAFGTVVTDPKILTVSGPSQGSFTWLLTEDATSVEGTLDGTNYTALTGEAVAGTIERFNVIGFSRVKITGDGTLYRIVA